MGDNAVELSDVVDSLRPTMRLWQGSGLVRSRNNDGSPVHNFGFAMVDPFRDLDEIDWDDPIDLAWFVGGWGPDMDMFIANAVRKLRPAVRNECDTLYLKHCDGNDFQDVVDSVDVEGRFPWGDFPHGGAVQLLMGHSTLLGAVSVYKEDEDCAAVAPFLGHIGLHLHRAWLATKAKLNCFG